MKPFAFIFCLLMTNAAIATTILNITIPKNEYILCANPYLIVHVNKEFPQKIYVSNPPYIKNPYYDKFFPKPSNDIRSRRFLFPILRLDLIFYDKSSGYYEFKLSVPKLGKYMPIPADVFHQK